MPPAPATAHRQDSHIPIVDPETRRALDREIDPRLPGGCYRSHGGQAYDVLTPDPGRTQPGPRGEIQVRWDDGTATSHCAAWDIDRDIAFRSTHPEMSAMMGGNPT